MSRTVSRLEMKRGKSENLLQKKG